MRYKFVRTDDLKIYYKQCGTGRPLLLLHGNCGSHRSFDRVIGELSKYFTCYAIDTRWHGRTQKGKKRITYPQFAEDLNGFVRTLALNKPHIIGYSDGGVTALTYAATFQNVGKVLTVGANFDTECLKDWIGQSCAETVAKCIKRRWMPHYARLLELTRLMIEPDRYADWRILSNIKTPVLLLSGDYDEVPIAHTEAIQAEIPNAKVKVFENCPHRLIRFETEKFLAEAMAFLEAKDLLS